MSFDKKCLRVLISLKSCEAKTFLFVYTYTKILKLIQKYQLFLIFLNKSFIKASLKVIFKISHKFMNFLVI